MPVIRVNKTKDYTVMSNYHFKDRRLTLKAKGLLSQMLSLPDSWDYTIAGLVFLNRESKNAIQSALKELEENGYLVRTKRQDEKGHFDYIYDIYENPLAENPRTENPSTVNPCTENPPQLNTNEISTYKQNTNDKSKGAPRFTPPTIDEVKAYCIERNNSIDPEAFIDFYESVGWKIGNKPMKDWRAAVRTWEKRQGAKHPKPQLSDWDREFLESFEEDEK